MAKKDNSTSSGKPTPPKKALTAFFIYKRDVYDDVKHANSGLKITDLTRIISEKWRNLDDKHKEKYMKKHDEAKAQYEKEKKAYEDKYGKIVRKKKHPKEDYESSDEDTHKKAKKHSKK